MNGSVTAIFLAPNAGDPMQQCDVVTAITGCGLDGDRYCTGEGSFNRGKRGSRQVTLMNARFFPNSGFDYADSRRNIITSGVELNWLIGREFTIGEATFRGVKYCDPCKRPSKLAGKSESFDEVFLDCGGIVAEVVQGGLIHVGDAIIPPPKGY